jgi:glycosyltransferase involved in cell wall biosynthesis
MPDQAPYVAPLPEEAVRPLWSVMIPTYQCAGLLRQTLKSVLDQDAGAEQMQIEVVDDASDDDVEAVVAEVGRGRVSFFRQVHNRGHVGNFNTCIDRARGHLIHILHGDDLVLPGFYQSMEKAFERNPDIGAAFCRYAFVDEKNELIRIEDQEREVPGVLENALDLLASRQRIQPPAIVVRRDVYECVGGFDPRMKTCAEDWEMWVRIARHYRIGYEPTVLAQYRRHRQSLASRSVTSGQNMRDARQAIDIFSADLPQDRRQRLQRMARESAARWALSIAKRAAAAGDTKARNKQLIEAVKTSRQIPVLKEALATMLGRR